MKPDHLIKGEEIARKMTSLDVYKLAIDMIKGEVERGDTIEQIKAGQMGRTLGEFVGFGSIGGFSVGDFKRYNSDYICIKLQDDREFIYKLKQVFDEIKNKQTSLF